MGGLRFEVGDVVRLWSGGTEMTVRNHITGTQALDNGWPEYVLCDWFDGAGNACEKKFHPSQLEPLRPTLFGVYARQSPADTSEPAGDGRIWAA